jgi:hypothetical protein
VKIRIDEKLLYDHDNGELQTWTDGILREAIEVRKQLMESVLRAAIILELEKLGYTVISPEASE